MDSGTWIWSLNGIQSVNLSAGYQHEHTEYETLDVEACYRTVKLLQGVFRNGRELRRVLDEVRREERRASVVRNR